MFQDLSQNDGEYAIKQVTNLLSLFVVYPSTFRNVITEILALLRPHYRANRAAQICANAVIALLL